MTKEQVEELERLEKAATPRPWDAGSGHSGRIFGATGEIAFWDANDDGGDWPADVVLAAAARNALPRLLEERKRLLAGLREAMEFLELEGDHGEAAWLALKEARAFAEEPARRSSRDARLRAIWPVISVA